MMKQLFLLIEFVFNFFGVARTLLLLFNGSHY